MKKQTKIGVMLLVTVILVLALAVPALAEEDGIPAYACEVGARIINEDDVIRSVPLRGELVAYWEGGTLYNYCSGKIPWGETFSAGWRYLTFVEVCEHFGDVATCTQNTISIAQEDWEHDIFIWDTIARWRYPSTDSLFEAQRGSGTFMWFKVYTP